MPEGPPAIARSARLHRPSILALIAVVLIVGGGVGMFLRAVDQAAAEGRSRQCEVSLRRIGLALHNYHAAYDCFPPAVTADAAGRPMHSWRTLILPFLGSARFYNSYNLAEPWDGPNNRKLHRIRLPSFSCPDHPDRAARGFASYFLVAGPGTMAPGPNRSIDVGDIRDGTGRTLMVVESSDADIHWMEPRDLDLADVLARPPVPGRPSISATHPGGPNALNADGSARRMGRGLAPGRMRALLTIDGGEVDPPDDRP